MKKDVLLRKVLVVSNSPDDITFFEDHNKSASSAFKFIISRETGNCLDILNDHKIDIMVVNCENSGSGLEFIQELKNRNVVTPIIALIAIGSEIEAARALKEGAYDYLLKDEGWHEEIELMLSAVLDSLPLEYIPDEEHEQQSPLFRQIYRSQKWWQHIIDAITDYLFVIDNSYKILRTNKAFANLFNKEPADIIMKPYYELFGLEEPHEWCILPKNEDDLVPGSTEKKMNGSTYLISYFPIFYEKNDAVVYIMKDITENKRLKDQIFHLDKLSSLGTLTSGVAHEINNPLTGIIGYTEMLLMKTTDEKHKKYLKNVYDSAMRCKRIVGNMLTFSRQKSSHKSLENINEIIDKTIELNEYWLKSSNIEVVRKYGDLPTVQIDHQQIQQVILNLLINAEHAIADTDRNGKIELETFFDEASGEVTVILTDNGCGIPDEVLPRIFDPFYTTKPVNKGTGLGLSIAHGIIAEQGGSIEADSVPGEGSSFTIRLQTG